MNKVALIHYWLTNMRGGENVFAEFCRLFPEADVFTHAWNPDQVKEPFNTHKITETFIARLPLARKKCQIYLPLMPTALSRLDFSGYDLILSNESGPSKGIRKPAGARHVCYCNTPMRYVWDMFDDYYRAAGMGGKIAMRMFKNYMRKYDLKSAEMWISSLPTATLSRNGSNGFTDGIPLWFIRRSIPIISSRKSAMNRRIIIWWPDS